MALVVREATVSDAGALIRLNDAFNGPGITAASVENSLLNNKNEYVLLALVDGEPAGFICGEVRASVTALTEHGEITELFVDERFRRRGVAGGLMSAMEKRFAARGLTVVTLETNQSNLTAQTFYKSRGYAGKLQYTYRKILSRE